MMSRVMLPSSRMMSRVMLPSSRMMSRVMLPSSRATSLYQSKLARLDRAMYSDKVQKTKG